MDKPFCWYNYIFVSVGNLELHQLHQAIPQIFSAKVGWDPNPGPRSHHFSAAVVSPGFQLAGSSYNSNQG